MSLTPHQMLIEKKKLTRNVMSKESRPLREISDKKKNVPNDKLVPT